MQGTSVYPVLLHPRQPMRHHAPPRAPSLLFLFTPRDVSALVIPSHPYGEVCVVLSRSAPTEAELTGLVLLSVQALCQLSCGPRLVRHVHTPMRVWHVFSRVGEDVKSCPYAAVWHAPSMRRRAASGADDTGSSRDVWWACREDSVRLVVRERPRQDACAFSTTPRSVPRSWMSRAVACVRDTAQSAASSLLCRALATGGARWCSRPRCTTC